MTRELVFVHGRAQENLDSVALKKSWIDAWRQGLSHCGLDLPIPEDHIHFPYYGDTLAQIVAGQDPERAAQIVVRGDDLERGQQEFLMQYIAEVQEATNIPDQDVAAHLDPEIRERGVLNWGWIQGILSEMDRRMPWVSGASIALFTNDVYQYLHKSNLRRIMDDGVRSAFSPATETVVVAHSLGTVVAYNVLKRDGTELHLKVPLFVTLGSPLAISVVKKALRPIAHPRCVGHWFNAMDDRDVVALFPLTADHFEVEPAIENKVDVDNATQNRHGISGYLGDPEVARRIYEAVA